MAMRLGECHGKTFSSLRPHCHQSSPEISGGGLKFHWFPISAVPCRFVVIGSNSGPTKFNPTLDSSVHQTHHISVALQCYPLYSNEVCLCAERGLHTTVKTGYQVYNFPRRIINKLRPSKWASTYIRRPLYPIFTLLLTNGNSQKSK